MAVSTANVLVGAPDRVTGAVMYAPLGTALPTTPIAAPNVAFVDLGYISEDGVSLSQSSSWEKIKDWGGDQVRTFLSEFTATLSFTFLETNDDALKAMYGAANVTVTAAGASTGKYTAVKLNSTEPPAKSWLFNMADSTVVDVARTYRIVVPNGQITERGDLNYTRNGAITYSVTLEAYPDSAGNSVYLYRSDGDYSG
jgi:hypothetical protein